MSQVKPIDLKPLFLVESPSWISLILYLVFSNLCVEGLLLFFNKCVLAELLFSSPAALKSSFERFEEVMCIDDVSAIVDWDYNKDFWVDIAK